MSWLHTWGGLLCGWLLCAIFFAGTLSVFRYPITHWMEAKPALAVHADNPVGVQPDVLEKAAQYLATHAAGATFWRIALPEQAGQPVELFWRNRDGPHQMAQRVLHPDSGELLAGSWGRKTEGGRHFMSFHYALHAGTLGFWLVGFVAMGMLVALVSGIVVHKRIFKDFFTFRPRKGQRSWLDAHNVTAVMTLPFLFVIVYTGLSLFYSSYMPLPMRAVYGTDDDAYTRLQSELSPTAPSRPVAGNVAPRAYPDLPFLLTQAVSLSDQAPAMFFIERPGQATMSVKVFHREPDTAHTRRVLNGRDIITFDGNRGRVLHVQRADPLDESIGSKTHRAVVALHVVSFGGWTMKWLYFLSGLAGTAMLATGTILFAVKRKQKSGHEFGKATPVFYRFVDIVNVAAVAGIVLASIAYFYGNRLIPADMADRASWEIRFFFFVWLFSLLHAMWRPYRRAWLEQWLICAVLCLGLPLLNAVTTGMHLLHYLVHTDWQAAGVELTALGFGIGCACMAVKIARAPAFRDRMR